MTTAMRLMEEGMKKGREEGREEGMMQNTKRTILRFYRDKKMELENIADLLDLQVSYVKKVLREEGLV